RPDQELRAEIADGLRALFLTPSEARSGPAWVREGVPLWIGLSYEFERIEERPHVAVSSRRTSEFEILRPQRAPWLLDSLGSLPQVVWFSHQPSGIALPVDTALLKTLRQAVHVSGPLRVPESVQRFMARLAGWEEQEQPVVLGTEHAVFLERPRGRVLAEAA